MDGRRSLQFGCGHRNADPREGFLLMVLDIPWTEEIDNPDILGFEVSDLQNTNVEAVIDLFSFNLTWSVYE